MKPEPMDASDPTTFAISFPLSERKYSLETFAMRESDLQRQSRRMRPIAASRTGRCQGSKRCEMNDARSTSASPAVRAFSAMGEKGAVALSLLRLSAASTSEPALKK